MPRAALAADGAAPASAQPALLEVTVNGVSVGEPVMLLTDAGGAFYAPATAIARWRLRLPEGDAVVSGGESYRRIDGIQGLELRYSQERQALELVAQPSLFEARRAEFGAAELLPMTPAATGGFVNYDLFAEYYGGQASLSGVGEFGIFTSAGVGTTSFVGRMGPGADRLTRLETSWTIDRPDEMRSIRIGDAVSVSGPGSSPVRFAGIQYARNFGVQPGFVTMRLVTLQGSAALPSVADVYVNNALQGSQAVNPGPFELGNIQVPTGGGTVQLVLRDMLGRTIVSEQSYYANAGLLRRGLHDFSYEIGFLRRGFGVRSNDYGSLMASTVHRYGISDTVTAEAHVQASRSVQLAGAGLLLALPGLGAVGGSGAVSRTERGTGAHATASLERQGSRFSLGLRGQYASRDFAFVGMPERHAPARFDLQAFADAPIASGSIGVNVVHRDNRLTSDETLAGVFGSFRIGNAAAVQLFARRTVAGTSHTLVGGHLSFAFGAGRSAAASAEHGRAGGAAYVSVQQNAPAGTGSGWRVAANAGEDVGIDAEFVHNSQIATHRAEVAYHGGRAGVRLSTAGSLAFLGGRAFASRHLGQSFAVVEVGRQPNVRVYADNRLVGVTDASGRAIVPGMRPFDRNMLRIDDSDLPMDVQLASSELAVRPFARSGALISFAVRRERGVLLRILLEDGSQLPPGAQVGVEGDAAHHIVASGGEVYLPAAEGRLRLVARWGGRSCVLEALVPDNDDPQPRLAGLVCRAGVTYAAR